MSEPVEGTAGSAAPASPFVQSQIVDRLVLQRGVFAGPTADTDADLYSTVDDPRSRRDRQSVHLESGDTLDTDTYFGRFPAAYHLRWTTLTTVDLRVRCRTSGRARVDVRASDGDGQVRIVTQVEVGPDSDTVTVPVELASFRDGGSVWAAVTAVDGAATIEDLSWSVPAPQTVRAPVVAICTFNRPADCVSTLATLASDREVLASLEAVYVVDQGTQLVRDEDEFDRLAAEFGDKLVYLRQPNLGGAGGFTRGMCETLDRHGDVHLVLMDDDIRPEPETVVRLNAFANVTARPMIVGAQMLYLLHPTRLHVGAEEADLGRLRAGRWSAHALHDADMLTERQDRVADAGYNGWWTCLIPAEIITRTQLPIPMFFQWDDIEFGIRARDVGGDPTVTVPGAAVWHMDFSAKDHDDWTMYFSMRNSLITAALHSDIDPKALSTTLFREISRYLVSMQYGLAYTALRGIEDFLAGPGVLADGGRHALETIRGDRGEFPETITHPLSSEVGASYPDLPARPAGFLPDNDRLDVVLAERAARQLSGRVESGRVAIPATDAHWWHVALFDEVVVPTATGTGVRVRTRDAALARSLTFRTLKLLKRFRADVHDVQHTYRAELPQLTNRENWQRLFTASGE
jgi:galactofuranosylgalactofuranosylrhamnosyl-N-acetylglucosaminyl-diphospho-decaprenol beta-1,5/1,6-galactofuranosyltransferase